MSWFQQVKAMFQETQELKESISTNPTIAEINGFFGENFALTGSKLTSVTYYSCMQIRCNAVAKLPLKLMRYQKRGSEKATNHPLYELFRTRPNPFVTPHDFLWATEFQRLEYGNAFWVPKIVNGKIEELYLLNSPTVSIMIDNTGILNRPDSVYYIYQDSQKGTLVYESSQIVHFKNFSTDGLEGTSVKKYISDIIDTEQYAGHALKQKYRGGLQDPLVVEYIGDLDEAMKEKIIKKFQNLGGAENAGKVVPIPTNFRINQIETKLVNSQFFQLQGLTARHIANAFGVKSFQLNDMEKSTYHNIEQQNKAFYSDTLQNVLTAYEQEMDYKLLTVLEREKGYYMKFNVDSILRSDLSSRTASYATGISSGYMTIAEVREKEDLPFKEGTENLIVGNGASIYLKDLGKQYEKGSVENEKSALFTGEKSNTGES